METATHILRYKELKQKALDLGLSEDNYGDYLHQLSILEGMLKAASLSMSCVTGEYRNIKMIDRDSKLAMDRSFTQEPYIAALKDLEPKAAIEKNIGLKTEEKEIEHGPERSDQNIHTPGLFDGIGH